MLERCSPMLLLAINRMHEISHELYHEYVSSNHLFIALLENPFMMSHRLCQELYAEPKALARECQNLLTPGPFRDLSKVVPLVEPVLRRVFGKAENLRRAWVHEHLGTEHILVAMSSHDFHDTLFHSSMERSLGFEMYELDRVAIHLNRIGIRSKRDAVLPTATPFLPGD